MTASQVLNEIAEMTINQKWNFYVEIEGWSYTPDPQTWSGGAWYRNDHGSVNQQGGMFVNITRAVEAMDRHYQNWERIN